MKPPYTLAAMLLVSASAMAADPPASADEVEQALVSVAKILAVRPAVRISASGDNLATNSAGVIELALPALERKLQGASGANRGLLLRFVLAHEAWHARQLSEPGGADLAAMNPFERRLRECAADTMAAYFVVKDAGDALLANPAGLENIRHLVWNLPLTEDFHPVGHQRDAAVTLGFRLAMIELLQQRPQLSEADGLALAQMRRMSDWNASDSAPAIAQRVCMQITQYDDGAGRLVGVTEAKFVFHPKAAAPYVHYAVSFRNSGQRAVQVNYTPKLMLALGVCGPARIPEDRFQPYLLFSNETRTFVIPPRQSHHLMGMLPWVPTPDRCPRIDFDPRSARTMISYRSADAAPSSPSCQGRPGNPSDPIDQGLASGLQRIANNAESDFEPLRAGAGNTFGDTTLYDANISLPGVKDLSISVGRNGVATIRGDVYEGMDAAKAREAFHALRNRLVRICPLTAGDWEESETDGENELHIHRFSNSSALRASLYRLDDNQYVVTLKIQRMKE